MAAVLTEPVQDRKSSSPPTPTLPRKGGGGYLPSPSTGEGEGGGDVPSDAGITKLGDAVLVAGAHLSQQLAALADTVSKSIVAVHRPGSGFGAGVVWDRTGVIVTNQHVVSGPWAEVSLASGTRLPARVAASHVGLDLAVLKVDSGGSNELVPATIGDSSRLRSGELVLAVGHPLGERNAVSLGVVSGLGVVGSRRGPREVIRLAISLRPGNSGGALSDAHGRVIGIPHMVVGHGLALAIPAHVVEAFLQFTHA